MISFHIEAVKDSKKIIDLIHSHSCRAGVALNPDTPLPSIESVLSLIDYVLVMSVHPGFEGQKFIDSALGKIEALTRLRKQKKLSFQIEVDGGIKIENAAAIAKAGADILVAGSAIFKSKNYGNTISQMREKIHAF